MDRHKITDVKVVLLYLCEFDLFVYLYMSHRQPLHVSFNFTLNQG